MDKTYGYVFDKGRVDIETATDNYIAVLPFGFEVVEEE